jgi:hypothetical protein
LNITAPSPVTRTLFVIVPSQSAIGLYDLVVDVNGRVTRPFKFQYRALEPLVMSALACKVCNSGRRCIVNNRCGSNVIPLISRTPFTGSSIVTVTIDSLNVGSTPANIRANLGSNRALVTASSIISASATTSVVEFQLPQDSQNRGSGIQFSVIRLSVCFG